MALVPNFCPRKKNSSMPTRSFFAFSLFGEKEGSSATLITLQYVLLFSFAGIKKNLLTFFLSLFPSLRQPRSQDLPCFFCTLQEVSLQAWTTSSSSTGLSHLLVTETRHLIWELPLNGFENAMVFFFSLCLFQSEWKRFLVYYKKNWKRPMLSPPPPNPAPTQNLAG